MISDARLRYLAGSKKLNLIYLEKDYFLTLLLYTLREIDGIVFKGGTALNKIFLNHTRLSEDLDFSCKGKISVVKKEIESVLNANKEIFPKFAFDKNTLGFFRMKIFYKSFFFQQSFLFLDINKKASIILPPQKQNVPHFYDEIPEFEILTLNIDEIIAEKIRALITRNQPRDYFDTYMLLEKGYKINTNFTKKKLKDAKEEFEIKRIFKNAQRIYSKWDAEISQLTNKPVEFMVVMKRLQKEFGYK